VEKKDISVEICPLIFELILSLLTPQPGDFDGYGLQTS